MKIRISPLDKLFSEYIRKRAMASIGGCERCFTQKKSYKELQCSHFYGRGKRTTRFDEDNCAGLCFGCHEYLGAHPVEHVEFFKARLGERFDLLTARAYRTGRPDENAITLYLKEKLKE